MRYGLHLFSDESVPAERRRRIRFVLLVVAASAALVWPVYPLFSGIRPLILGLPLSMAWVVFWLVVVFAGTLRLYLSEEDE